MQEWLKKLIGTEEEKYDFIYLPTHINCKICHKYFEKELLEDFTIEEECKNYPYEEWMKKLDETTDYCPLCGHVFNYISNCVICGKRFKTNKKIRETGGINASICDREQCQNSFFTIYEKGVCELCKSKGGVSLKDDYTHEQIFEENTREEWEKRIGENKYYCPLCGLKWRNIGHCRICGKLFKSHSLKRFLCDNKKCKSRHISINRKIENIGKGIRSRRMYRKRKKLKNIKLWGNPFPEEIRICWHHINNFFILPIPEVTHNFVGGGSKNRNHWKYNMEMIEKIYCIDLLELLKKD